MVTRRLFKTTAVFFLAFTLMAVPMAGSAAEKKSITRKMLLAGRVGDPWYVLSQALAYFVNKQSDWLRIEVVATPGVAAGGEMAPKNPELYLFITGYLDLILFPKEKRWNYYDKARTIGLNTSSGYTCVTYDKNIKTAQDLIGKTIFVARKAGGMTYYELGLLKEAGVLDKVKILHGGLGAAKSALMDGLADAAYMLFDYVYPDRFSKGAIIEELETRKPVYYVNVMPRDIQLKLNMVPVNVSPGSFSKNQNAMLVVTTNPAYFCVDERMDESVVREVTKILYENSGNFNSWHAQGANLTKTFIPTYVETIEEIHPVALKYYKELGVEIKSLRNLLP